MSDREALRHVDRIAYWARMFIKVIGGALATIFTWLQVKDIPFAAAVEHAQPEYLMKFTLVFYYFCWVFGSSFDVSVQQAVYVVDPHRGRMPLTAFVLVFLFAVVAAGLLWGSGDPRIFALILTAFMSIGVVSVFYIIQFVGPMIDASKKEITDLFDRERLHVVEIYMTGRWQIVRTVTLSVLVVWVDIVSFSDEVRYAIGVGLNYLAPNVSVYTMMAMLPTVGFLIFVVVSEGWQWSMRLVTKISLHVLGELKNRYAIRPRSI